MEPGNRNTLSTPDRSSSQWNFREPGGSRSGRVFGGLIILAVGLLILAAQMGADFPDWLISWPVLSIVIGLYLGFRHSFRGPVWLILLAIGSIFLIDEMEPSFDLSRYVWPVILMVIGLVLIFKPKKKHSDLAGAGEINPSASSPTNSDDSIDSVTIFGGVRKKIISKTFRGGELTTIFGGTELDLTQADVPGRIELELTQIFGGTKLLVPPQWRIQSDDLVSIFGGLDDKRPVNPNGTFDPNKVLVLKGTCIFGGIDIKSY